MWKLNCKVCSFILRNRPFGMEPRSRLLKIPNSGLWSVTTNNLGHPRVYICAVFSAQATARASPSVGAYPLSALLVKREPAYTSFHPVLQHNSDEICDDGDGSGQLQCFCNRRKPIPCLLQSHWRHVQCPPITVECPNALHYRAYYVFL